MTDLLTPKEKLALSRAELLAAMGYTTVGTDAGTRVVALAKDRVRPRSGWTRKLEEKFERSVVARWWRRSHLSTVAEVGRPLLQNYAARHPGKLVAYAAGAGALVVLVKPWRLLSLGMIVGLIVRSTDVQGFMSDYLVPELGDTQNPRDDFLDPSNS